MRLPAPQKGGCGGPGPGQWQDAGRLFFGRRPLQECSQLHCQSDQRRRYGIEAGQEYTEADLDYNNRDSRVYREHDDASLRDIPLVKDKADNWEGYDTVFIGYPIWWGSAPGR